MNTYESPTIIELGTVEAVTRGSGNDHAWDSNWAQTYGFLGGLAGFPTGTGGDPGVS